MKLGKLTKPVLLSGRRLALPAGMIVEVDKVNRITRTVTWCVTKECKVGIGRTKNKPKAKQLETNVIVIGPIVSDASVVELIKSK